MLKTLFSTIAIILTFIAFYPYIHAILRRRTKPHVFSWIIWGLTTCIAFFAQLAGGAGIGAWSIGFSGMITLYVALLAYQYRTDNSIVQVDWLFFILALSALPSWYFTSDPFWAILILTVTDLLGFVPTVRKAYIKPFEENLIFFILMAIRNGFAVAALEDYSMTTVLFPAAIAIVCILFTVMVLIRRAMLKKIF